MERRKAQKIAESIMEGNQGHDLLISDDIATAILSAVAEEREACAKLAETLFDGRYPSRARMAGRDIAASIRAQTQEQ